MDLKVHVYTKRITSANGIIKTIDTVGSPEKGNTISWCLWRRLVKQIIYRQEGAVSSIVTVGKVVSQSQVGKENRVDGIVINIHALGKTPVLVILAGVTTVQECSEIASSVGQVGQVTQGRLFDDQDNLLVHPGTTCEFSSTLDAIMRHDRLSSPPNKLTSIA